MYYFWAGRDVWRLDTYLLTDSSRAITRTRAANQRRGRHGKSERRPGAMETPPRDRKSCRAEKRGKGGCVGGEH